MPAHSTVMTVALPVDGPRPTTLFSTSIMKSGVARPSTLITKEAAASFRITGRTRVQSGAYQAARRSSGRFSRIARARVPSAITSSVDSRQARPSTTSSTTQWPARPATTTWAGWPGATRAKGSGRSSSRSDVRSSACGLEAKPGAHRQESLFVETRRRNRRQAAHVGLAQRPADLLGDIEQRAHERVDRPASVAVPNRWLKPAILQRGHLPSAPADLLLPL